MAKTRKNRKRKQRSRSRKQRGAGVNCYNKEKTWSCSAECDEDACKAYD